jgi:hypothetical protein
MNYYNKYIKYKNKYLMLMRGGDIICSMQIPNMIKLGKILNVLDENVNTIKPANIDEIISMDDNCKIPISANIETDKIKPLSSCHKANIENKTGICWFISIIIPILFSNKCKKSQRNMLDKILQLTQDSVSNDDNNMLINIYTIYYNLINKTFYNTLKKLYKEKNENLTYKTNEQKYKEALDSSINEFILNLKKNFNK